MRQIDQLLQTLDETETKTVFSLELQGKQREVMDGLILSRNNGSSLEGVDFGLTNEHFHQICSVLLQRCYKALAPIGLVDLSSFLTAKNLAKLLYQQLRLYERKIINAHRRIQKKFYTIAFETVQWVSFDEYDHALINHFGNELLKARENSLHGATQFIEIRKLRTRIREVFIARDAAIADKKDIHSLLEHYSLELEGSDDERGIYQLHVAFVDYFIFIGKDLNRVLSHIDSARSYMHCLPKWLAKEELHIVDAQMADVQYMLGNYASSFELYTIIWKVVTPKRLVARNFYHTLRFAEVAIIMGKTKLAEELLDSPIMSKKNHLITCSKQIRLALLCVLDNRTSDALSLIGKAMKHNKGKSYSLNSDIRLRFLEAMCVYLSGDWERASMLNVRSLQLLQRKKLGLAVSDFGYYFKFIEAVMIQHEIGTPIPDRLKAHYKKYSNGHHKLFVLILEKLLMVKGPSGWLPIGSK